MEEKKYFVTRNGMYFVRRRKGKAFYGNGRWEAALFTLRGAKRVATIIKGTIYHLDDDARETKYLFG